MNQHGIRQKIAFTPYILMKECISSRVKFLKMLQQEWSTLRPKVGSRKKRHPLLYLWPPPLNLLPPQPNSFFWI